MITNRYFLRRADAQGPFQVFARPCRRVCSSDQLSAQSQLFCAVCQGLRPRFRRPPLKISANRVMVYGAF